MTHTNPTLPVTDELAAAESYPTFWDAIPVETPPAENTPSPIPAPPQDDTYETFLSQSEEGGTATLNVEQTDVG